MFYILVVINLGDGAKSKSLRVAVVRIGERNEEHKTQKGGAHILTCTPCSVEPGRTGDIAKKTYTSGKNSICLVIVSLVNAIDMSFT